jgi:hypothetical protein
MTVIKEKDVNKGNGSFAFPGKVRVTKVSGEKFFYVNEPDELLVSLELDIVMFSYESPFGGGVEPEKSDTSTARINLPLEKYQSLEVVPFKVGDEFECFWKDGFGVKGSWVVKGLQERIK